jgi:hypothetical protein
MLSNLFYDTFRGTLDYGLHLFKSSISGLISYTDVDWGGCPDTRRSTSGYTPMLIREDAPIPDAPHRDTVFFLETT